MKKLFFVLLVFSGLLTGLLLMTNTDHGIQTKIEQPNESALIENLSDEGIDGLLDELDHSKSLFITENKGQYPEDVSHCFCSDNSIIWFKESAIAIIRDNDRIDITFEGSKGGKPIGTDIQKFYSNYFIDDVKATKVAHYKTVKYPELYVGISLVFTSNSQGLICELEQTGRMSEINNHQITITVDKKTRDGSITIETNTLTIAANNLITYITNMMQHDINENNDKAAPVTFPMTSNHLDSVPNDKVTTAGNINMTYFSYLGKSNIDVAYDIAVDNNGDIWITGYTESSDFPITTNAYQSSFNGGEDVFVAKFSNVNQSLLYSSYLGGSGEDRGWEIAIDDSGNVWVTGYTFSSDFPMVNAYQNTYGGGKDVFVAKLNSTGQLMYSSYLGGNNIDHSDGITFDINGNVWITGHTYSSDFPMVNAYQNSNAGSYDAFVAKFTADGQLLYSSYLGSSLNDRAYGIATDSNGNVWIIGYTASSDFPTTTNAFQSSYGGGDYDAFIAKFTADSQNLSYSSYIGGR